MGTAGRGALRAWSAVRDVKARAVERAERALAAQRALLPACHADIAAGTRACDDAAAACARDAARVAALLDDSGGMSVRRYLEHAAEGVRLEHQRTLAAGELAQAEQRLADQLRNVGAAQRDLGRLQSQYDLSLERLAQLDRARLRAEEEAQDEEAAETSLARHCARAREAANPANSANAAKAANAAARAGSAAGAGQR